MLRGDLENIVGKALKKNPQERYASVREFAEDLQRYLDDEPVLARPDSTWYRVRKFMARHRLPVAIAAIALLAVLATAVFAMSKAISRVGAGSCARAVLSRRGGRELPVHPDHRRARSGQARDRQRHARAERVPRELEYRDNPEDRAAVVAMLAQYYQTSGDVQRAERMLRQA